MVTKLKLSGNTSKICQCAWNCGEITKPGRDYVYGHGTRKIKPETKFCACGCKGIISPRAKQFINGHHSRVNNHMTGKKQSPEHIEARRLGRANKSGWIVSDDHKEKNRQAMFGNQHGLGYKNTDEFKEKARQKAIKQLEDPNCNFGKNWKGKKESYPERQFREYLENMGAIKGKDFFQEYPVGRYRIDFAYIDEQGKRGIEIDGGQHLLPEAMEHDRIRDKWLTKQGWNILRIPVVDLKYMLTGNK